MNFSFMVRLTEISTEPSHTLPSIVIVGPWPLFKATDLFSTLPITLNNLDTTLQQEYDL